MRGKGCMGDVWVAVEYVCIPACFHGDIVPVSGKIVAGPPPSPLCHCASLLGGVAGGVMGGVAGGKVVHDKREGVVFTGR